MTDAELKPEWFTVGDELLWHVIGIAMKAARGHPLPSIDLQPLAELALQHHAGCMEASIHINRRGKHSTAMCLIRQSVEALTVAEIGLQPEQIAVPLLTAWKKGTKSQGELRKALERDVWPSYGRGLWDETWAEFYANLVKAVQPYAHYTSELQGWQFVTVANDGGPTFIAQWGPETYDALKASRITFFHMLLTWMLGRILLTYGRAPEALERRGTITRLGDALASSKLLFKRGEWWAQFAPHMLFNPGHSWRDDS